MWTKSSFLFLAEGTCLMDVVRLAKNQSLLVLWLPVFCGFSLPVLSDLGHDHPQRLEAQNGSGWFRWCSFSFRGSMLVLGEVQSGQRFHFADLKCSKSCINREIRRGCSFLGFGWCETRTFPCILSFHVGLKRWQNTQIIGRDTCNCSLGKARVTYKQQVENFQGGWRCIEKNTSPGNQELALAADFFQQIFRHAKMENNRFCLVFPSSLRPGKKLLWKWKSTWVARLEQPCLWCFDFNWCLFADDLPLHCCSFVWARWFDKVPSRYLRIYGGPVGRISTQILITSKLQTAQ